MGNWEKTHRYNFRKPWHQVKFLRVNNQKPNDEKPVYQIRLKKSILTSADANTSGSKKLSNAQSSWRLFCKGVPVSNSLFWDLISLTISDSCKRFFFINDMEQYVKSWFPLPNHARKHFLILGLFYCNELQQRHLYESSAFQRWYRDPVGDNGAIFFSVVLGEVHETHSFQINTRAMFDIGAPYETYYTFCVFYE